jgi:hypothetical protein
LETRNAGVTAKRSDSKREAFAFVDDQESLAADFVSDWSDGHLIGFLFEFFAFGNHSRSLETSLPNPRELQEKSENIFSRTRIYFID